MSELTAEELALLQATESSVDEPKRRGRPRKVETVVLDGPVTVVQQPPARVRGPHTPVQFVDDGWGGVPVQMRG